MRTAEGVPQRKLGVVAAIRHPRHGTVAAAVGAIDVGDVDGRMEHPIKRSHKQNRRVAVRRRIEAHAGEDFVPLPPRGRADALQIPSGNLLRE